MRRAAVDLEFEARVEDALELVDVSGDVAGREQRVGRQSRLVREVDDVPGDPTANLRGLEMDVEIAVRLLVRARAAAWNREQQRHQERPADEATEVAPRRIDARSIVTHSRSGWTARSHRLPVRAKVSDAHQLSQSASLRSALGTMWTAPSQPLARWSDGDARDAVGVGPGLGDGTHRVATRAVTRHGAARERLIPCPHQRAGERTRAIEDAHPQRSRDSGIGERHDLDRESERLHHALRVAPRDPRLGTARVTLAPHAGRRTQLLPRLQRLVESLETEVAIELLGRKLDRNEAGLVRDRGAVPIRRREAGERDVAVQRHQPQVLSLRPLEEELHGARHRVRFGLAAEAGADEGGDRHGVARRGRIGRGREPEFVRAGDHREENERGECTGDRERLQSRPPKGCDVGCRVYVPAAERG
jgi:hypothetical protein